MKCFSEGSKLLIGMSGFGYGKLWHHEGSFYPPECKSGQELQFYASEYNFVEINTTFYRIPKEQVFEEWKAKAPRPSFQFAIKAHRYFTHMKKLIVDDAFRAKWDEFYTKCTILGDHLGPILFQFPAHFQVAASSKQKSTLHRLRELAQVLPRSGKFVFEFRHHSWYCEEVYDLMRSNNWCLAWIHCVSGFEESEAEGAARGKAWNKLGNGRHPELMLNTADWGVYIRLYGTAGQYIGTYGAERLKFYVDAVKPLSVSSPNGRAAYFAFNNTDDLSNGSSSVPSCICDGRTLAELCRDEHLFS
mmetsp:Transcript_20847/g.34326  ORF Transcript_20847/g.34326 Transcript_20847/m.34326 type:complete len:303 (+) Transcript_20847:723-1631(+)